MSRTQRQQSAANSTTRVIATTHKFLTSVLAGQG